MGEEGMVGGRSLGLVEVSSGSYTELGSPTQGLSNLCQKFNWFRPKKPIVEAGITLGVKG